MVANPSDDQNKYGGAYGSLGEGGAGLLDTPTGDSADPFADDFFAGPDTPAAKERKEWSVSFRSWSRFCPWWPTLTRRSGFVSRRTSI